MRALYRFIRRRGMRWSIVGIYMLVIAAGLIATTVAHAIAGPHAYLSMAIMLGLFAVFRLSEAIEDRAPPVTLIKASSVEVGEGSKIILSTQAINDSVDRAVRKSAGRQNEVSDG